MRRPRLTAAAVASACAFGATACGQSLDKGGFSSGDRAAATAALGALERTSIPTTLVVLTNTAGTVPAVCRVHIESSHGRRFALFVFWRPSKRAARGTYTWFRATLMDKAKNDTFRSGYVPLDTGEAGALKANAGDAFTRPSDACELLMNGDVRLRSQK
jgi:hypothetical protein